uniref:DNA-directed RNA polymerase RBP11-like dimerisation domain-containing protein n=1 Tax=Haptolina ericina TaxID=156174 RepID=A0A7S3BP96_9EUKA|mmetsp:Transcript_62855/g.139951  ORF Transcript_62855/g.139951 Transcript_62855/m.139951 type:complete len:183 (+) Transcript_62855:65-613(+)
MNKPDDFDCWRLPDDGLVQKVTCMKDTKVQNAMMYVIEREDHTLGNLMRMHLLDDEDVVFGGYRVVWLPLPVSFCSHQAISVCMFRCKLRCSFSLQRRPTRCSTLQCTATAHFPSPDTSPSPKVHPLEPAIQLKVMTRNEHVTPTQAVQATIHSLVSELDQLEERFKTSLIEKKSEYGARVA